MSAPRLSPPPQKALLTALAQGDRIAMDSATGQRFIAETGQFADGRTIASLRKRGFVDEQDAYPLFPDGAGGITDAGRAAIR